MTQSSAASLREGRVLNIFQRRGGSGQYTKPFRDFTHAVQECLAMAVDVRDGEAPLLASYRSSDSWVLLTTERLVWRSNETVASLTWAEIGDATIPDSLFESMNPLAKKENATLKLITSDGTDIELELEPGRPFAGFWNVLKTVGTFD